jgi:HSP20 family protein
MQQGLKIAMKPVEQQPQKLSAIDRLRDRVRALRESIARRAFELFQGRGGRDGGDVEDWLRAEAELCHKIHLEVAETDDALSVRAEIPGFSSDELEVSVEPHLLTILGERKARTRQATGQSLSDAGSDQILQVVSFSVEVEPNQATALLGDGILELAIPKAGRRKVSAEGRTDWIVRLEDSLAWTESFNRGMAPATDRTAQRRIR